MAYGEVKDSATVNRVGIGSATSTFKDVKAGWTAGGGIEGAFGGGWSAKLEYLYVDLGKTEFTIGTPGMGTIASETFAGPPTTSCASASTTSGAAMAGDTER